ncbi:DNA-directed RNA polymerase I subunit RPA2 [Zootermopsis nevadensis]|uniref:DNA-directed RNA polymerase I subunit RPA2 n=1 Tax=Zootermopsis nevadensis TaxID=136037 RepID=UPI000B8EBB90|nr:DNA-directed RNA polymerase I subunit RPA2 [Zootermopsis nevadensis]
MSFSDFKYIDVEPSLKNLTTDLGRIPQKQDDLLQSLGAPHVESFNYILREGLDKAVNDILATEFCLQNDDRISIKLESAKLCSPLVPHGSYGVKSPKIFPTECRQRGVTYRGHLITQLSFKINGVQMAVIEKDLGQIPIMVKSDICHLSKLTPKQLIEKGEHAEEWGGYFILGGHERIVRMLQLTRRNYPLTVTRTSWKQRGNLFSDLGVMIRCVKDDQTTTNNVLHFVRDGSAKLMFSHKLNLYYTPIMLILKCLLDVSDEYIIHQFMAGYEDDTYMKGCVMNMMQAMHEEGIHTHYEAKRYIGKTFKVRFYDVPPWTTDEEICDFIIKHSLAIHLENNEDKFNLYIMMMQKLFSVVQNKCCVEGADGLMMHELLLGGHLYLQLLKDKMQTWLQVIKSVILKKAKTTVGFILNTNEVNWALRRSGTIESAMNAFLATGNVFSSSGLGLMQDKGLTVMAENINRMRYMSHFRSVHRGSFFQEMRTSEPRQLLPEAWGFICPVHTPDGAPCGLLNHLTKYCEVTSTPDPRLVANIPSLLVSLGMVPLKGVRLIALNHNEQFVVLLDGRVLGHVEKREARRLVDKLRFLKIVGKRVPRTLEIVLVPMGRKCGQFPGLFLFTGPARMMRPVINLAAKKVELIGTFEQVYMDICIYPEEAYEGITTHQEVTDTSFLSNLACLIPMPDCNQSPRNMYQCQMGKQTMGTPCHTWHLQAECKLYRLQTPASPFFRPGHYDLVGLDEFAMGTNAVVAVISYTGYDMEDAMIINKASYERGFAHGCVYKSEFVELKSQKSYFGLDPERPELQTFLDSDGLPHPGVLLKQGQSYCCYYDDDEAKFRIEKWKGKEDAYIDNVRLCGNLSAQEATKACIVFRIPRNPSVGDKFASRAGQKGICSYLWPQEDLPYTETGLIPDIVFNPHGFPSRMTIAMMIEVMAGKSAVLHGLVHDAAPFRFSEEYTAIDYFGKMLEAGGYNYYSTEKMYSGIDGCEMKADIFFGIVHYQRLRHMVSDKWQVRSTGPIDVLTHQPVKGRRRGGGVRFGEMERDSLLSYETLQMLLCKTCGSILSPLVTAQQRGGQYEQEVHCKVCQEKGKVEEVEMPYIFRYLVAQLASVNIKIKIDVVEQ